jgi:hypothetical protein
MALTPPLFVAKSPAVKLTKVAHLCLALLVLCVDALPQQTRLTRNASDTDFISARYSDSLIGEPPSKSAACRLKTCAAKGCFAIPTWCSETKTSSGMTRR